MCTECGCGLPGKPKFSGGKMSQHAHAHDHSHEHAHSRDHNHEHDHSHDHNHEHDHSHDHKHEHTHEHTHEHSHDDGHVHSHAHKHTHSHSHDHSHEHSHDHAHEHPDSQTHDHKNTVVAVHKSIMNANNLQAARNRGFFAGSRVLAVNVLSSPGAGKTKLLTEAIKMLSQKQVDGRNLNCGVVVGDLETDNDAVRLRQSGAPVVQISTGTLCHLDAAMLARSLSDLAVDPTQLDILFIENVGNLVCPATFDLGEGLRITVLSAAEGEDKPLKYPPAFHFADLVVLSKSDLAEACEFDRELALKNIRSLKPEVEIVQVSAKTGEGLEVFCQKLIDHLLSLKQQSTPGLLIQ